jgi:glucokinase
MQRTSPAVWEAGVERSGSPEGVVLADVGGTNVRFAVLRNGAVGTIAHMAVADYPQFADALGAFMAAQTDRGAIRHALFGVAGVVTDERCALTNNSWIVATDELRARFGFSDVHIVNDFEAVAWSLPNFAGNDLRAVGGGPPRKDAPMVVLGPGTGLGLAAYLPLEHGGLVVRSEGGHVTLPSSSAGEDAIIAKLRQRFGHVSAERALSGSGLENLYHAIASLESKNVPERKAAEITQAALAGTCVISRAALDTFCALLGTVAGNFALSFGAQGGVYIAGGIVSHILDFLPHSQFRMRFEAKGRLSPYVRAIPAYLILHDDPAFVGLQSLAAQRVAN